MYKKIFVTGLVLIVLAAVSAGAYQSYQSAAAASPLQAQSARATSPAGTTTGQGTGSGQGYRGGQGNANGTTAQTGDHQLLPAPSDLSSTEAEGLIFMREEEKLAHDVYVTLYEQWGLATFQSISLSEQQHSDSVKALLDIYGLDDPATSQVGVFTNPELQAQYNELVARGGQSLAEALKVGAAIEEIDILDLQERLANTDNADIQQVYNNLMRGSESHLRAFTSNLLSQTGETYQPQYLSAEAYQAILSRTNGRGNGQGGQGGGGQGQSSQGGGRGYRGGRP